MPHLIVCPECAKPLQVPEELVGKTVQCPECRHTFTARLPDEQGETPKETSKPADWDKLGTQPGVAKTTNQRDDDDRPKRDYDDDDDEVDIARRRRSVRRDPGSEKPGKVQAIAIMTLIGGIIAILVFLALGGASGGVCCLWPGLYYSLVLGILAIIKGASLLGDSAATNVPPTGIAVMMIINIINGDVPNVVLGIVILVFCGDDEVKNYLRGSQ